MINIDVIEYAFVDESIAQALCEALKIESVQLIKKTTDKSLWWTKRSNYHSCHLFKNDHLKTYWKSYFYVDY
jgi:hypothetical protein